MVNSSGTWVAQYTYNAWGEIITSSGTMADINPLRYRGYYYDTETGFYYLQSRYYDPVTHRFINADGYASTGQSVLGTNMFAYCLNCPIVLVDLSGTVPSPSAMLYQGDSCNITYYSTGDAISIAVSDNFIYIDAHMTFSGYIDTTILVAGIKEYWEGQYLIDGKTKTVVVNIYEGSSSNGYTVTVNSFYGNGTSNTICAEDIWHTTKESRIEIFSRYKSGHPKNIGWSMAHEFGHSLGVKDYYTHVKAKEFGFHKNYLSIFNRAGMHATSVDIGKVLSAFESNSHQDWRWYD